VREQPIPVPEFWVLDVSAVPHAAAPTISFRMRVRDHSELEIYTVALTAQIHLEAAQRPHDDETRARLADVFGEPERWGDTARGVMWAKRDVLVPSFTGSTAFDLQIPCSTDLEEATTRYLEAVPDGEAPLSFHFNGKIFYRGGDGRMQLTMVPWHAEAQFRLPLDVWRAAVGDRGGLVRVSDDTFEALRRHRIDAGLPSLGEAVADLLKARVP
jgi:Family of unknown function (DUF6084)